MRSDFFFRENPSERGVRQALPCSAQGNEPGRPRNEGLACQNSASFGFESESQSDQLLGEGGNDTLSGDGGDDLLCGGGGTDRFAFADGFGTDTIGQGLGSTPQRFRQSPVKKWQFVRRL